MGSPGEQIRATLDQNMKNELIWDADGFAAVLPSDKREVVMTLRKSYGVVCGMTGDGVNDAPALSAAQVGIAVEGATDAAKNAADLILTKAGLSPIYGAVIESRRIFAKVKSYVVYRVAASITLVVTLSTIVFISRCTVDSLMVIVLALMNDVSMIPVAYDNAFATKQPQMAIVWPLVTLSLYYGVIQTGLALIYFYTVANSKSNIDFDLNSCNGSTQGQIWLYLVLCTELMVRLFFCTCFASIGSTTLLTIFIHFFRHPRFSQLEHQAFSGSRCLHCGLLVLFLLR
jgi:H+-transporting ATPase